jgi:DNA-binding MarR family transcriptional regulator
MTVSVSRLCGIFSFLRAAGSLEGFVDAKLAEIGLSIPKLAALQRLEDAGGVLPLGQLADRLACVKSNVTQLVDRLESDGLVARESDPLDKRCRRAVITDLGRRMREEGARVHRDAEAQLFAGISPDERERLGEILDKLKSHTSSCRH